MFEKILDDTATKIKIIGKIYKIILLSNDETHKIPSTILYILNYNIRIVNTKIAGDNKYYSNKIIPLYFTINNAITPLGIFTDYVYCGAFICKMMDYKIQCYKMVGDSESCSDKYYWIGNRYDKLKFIENINLAINEKIKIGEFDSIEAIGDFLEPELLETGHYVWKSKYLKYKKNTLN